LFAEKRNINNFKNPNTPGKYAFKYAGAFEKRSLFRDYRYCGVKTLWR